MSVTLSNASPRDGRTGYSLSCVHCACSRRSLQSSFRWQHWFFSPIISYLVIPSPRRMTDQQSDFLFSHSDPWLLPIVPSRKCFFPHSHPPVSTDGRLSLPIVEDEHLFKPPNRWNLVTLLLIHVPPPISIRETFFSPPASLFVSCGPFPFPPSPVLAGPEPRSFYFVRRVY